MNSRSESLAVTQPFDLARSLIFLEKFRPMKGEQDIRDGTVTKALMIKGQTVVFQLAKPVEGDKPELKLELFSDEPLTDDLTRLLSERVSFMFSLKEDVNQFYEIARRDDPKFYPVVKKFWGFHHVKFPSTLEAAVWAILAQRGPMLAARKMKQALIERFGWSITLEGKKHWAFPDYSRVMNTSARELRWLIGNERKAEHLAALFRGYERIDENLLLTADFDEAKKTLMGIKGIGDWSATFILSRGLGRMERLPQNLKSVQDEIKKIYGQEQPPDRIAVAYGKWAGYWLLYVWASRMRKSKNKKDRPT